MFTTRDNKIVLLRAFCIGMLMKISHVRGIHKRSKEQASLRSCAQRYPPTAGIRAVACSPLEDGNSISRSLLILLCKEVFAGLERVKRTSFYSGLAQILLFSGCRRGTRKKGLRFFSKT